MKVCEAVNDALWPAILKPNATKKNKETVIEQFEASVYDYEEETGSSACSPPSQV